MKLFVVLACLLATTWGRSPLAYDATQEVKQWEYDYEGQIMSGIPTVQEKYSGLGIKCYVEVRKLAPQQFEMEMKNLKFAQVNKRFHEGSFSNKLKPLVYTSDPELERELKKPIKFRRIDGRVNNISSMVTDKCWSVNIKKAVLSMLNIDLKTVRENSQGSDQTYRPTTTIQEVNTQGECPNVYEVFPKGQGPKTLSQLKEDMNESEVKEDPRNLIQVSKVLQLDQCEKRPMLVLTTPTMEYCRDCDSRSQDRFSESAMIRYVLSPSTLRIRDVYSEGETIIPHLGEHTAVTSSSQRMYLLRVWTNIEGVEVAYSNEAHSEATTLMNDLSLKHMFEMISNKRHGTNDPEQVLPPSLDYMSEESEKVDQFSRTEKQELANKIKEALTYLARDIMYPSRKMQDLDSSKPTTDVGFMALIQYISTFTSEELNSMYRAYNAVPRSEENQIRRKILLDIIASSGAEESVKFLKRLVDERELKSYEAVDVLSGLQEGFRFANENYINEHINLCHHGEIRKNHFQHSTVCIGLGQIIRRTCKAPLAVLITRKPLLPSICRPEKLNRTIDRLAERLSSSNEQEKAVYLQALGHTGTARALEKIRPYVQKQELFPILRTSAITALRHIAYYYPQQVLETVLPIFNNRREFEVVRIAASTIVFASRPSFPVLEKIAIDLNHETDNQVGSFVYTTLYTLANSSAPCMQAMAVNATKVIKLAKPFRLDRTTAYRKIFTLTDLSDNVNILADNEFVTSKKSGLPKYGSTRLSVSTPGKILSQLFEARMFHNGIERSILEKFMVSRNDMDTLPVYFKNILEKVKSMPQTGEKKEGEALVRLFERTLFAYINHENIDSYTQKIRNTVRSVQERLRSNYTSTYVKVMLPLKSFMMAPSMSGLTVSAGHATELLFALRLKNVTLKMSPENYLTERSSRLTNFKIQGTIIPFIRYESVDVVATVNAGLKKVHTAGHINRFIYNLPASYKLNYRREDHNMTTVFKPHVRDIFFYHKSAPFTGLTNVRTMKPLYDTEGSVDLITNEKPIRINRQVGKDTFGVGLRVNGYTENPWAMHTLAWFKQMKEPSRELPATITRLVMNPWLSRRHILVKVEPKQQYEQEIRLWSSVSYKRERQTDNLVSQPQEVRDRVVFKTRLDGTDRLRYVNGVVHVNRTAEELHKLDIRVTRSPFHYTETSEKKLCVSGRLTLLRDYEEDSLYNPYSQSSNYPRQSQKVASSELRFRYGRQCEGESEITLKHNLTETVKDLDEMTQPRKALVYELKRRCKQEQEQLIEQRYKALQEEQTPEFIKQSRACIMALKNKGIVRVSDLDIRKYKVDINTKPFMSYVKYFLFPYMELNQSRSQKEIEQSMEPNQVRLTFDNLQGLAVNTVTVVDRNGTVRFRDVHHDERLVNFLLAVPTLKGSTVTFPYRYLVPARGLCRIAGSSITTFDEVHYPLSQSQCEFIAVQDQTPEQKFVVTFAKKSPSSEAKVLKVLVGSRIIEVQPPSTSYWSNYIPTVTVDGQIIQLTSETSEHHTFLTTTKVSPLIIKLRSHQSLSNQMVEIYAPGIGLKVETDGNNILVKVPKSRRGQLGGLCGDNNGEQVAEFRGQDECEYRSVEEFIKSYQIPSLNCPVQPKPSYCEQQERYDQNIPREMVFGQNIEMRNKYNTTISSDICFSTSPLPRCRRGYAPSTRQAVEVRYHCIEPEATLARRFVEIIDSEDQYDQEILNKLLNKSADHVKMEMLPSSCRPQY